MKEKCGVFLAVLTQRRLGFGGELDIDSKFVLIN